MKRILLPVDFPDISRGVAQQAAFLARQYHSEIVLLRVVTPLKYLGGLFEKGHQITERDLHAEVIKRAEENLEQALRPELQGLSVKRLLLRGDPAREIVQTSQDEKADVVAMASNGVGAIYGLLLGSVTAKVLHECDCPVWIGAHTEDARVHNFSIRKVLFAVDLDHPHSKAISAAAQLAADFGAALILVHVTPGVEIYGPGGPQVLPEFKKEVVDYSTAEIAELQREAGTEAEVMIESGSVHKMLNQVAKQTNADLLVIGRLAPGGHLGANSTGYAIIRDSPVPVLSM